MKKFLKNKKMIYYTIGVVIFSAIVVSIFVNSKFYASVVTSTITNQATLTYTDSLGQSKTVSSNIVSITVNTTIDDVPPTGSVIIDSGNTSTASTSVNLTISASDDSGTVSSMRLSNDGITWNTWAAYTTSVTGWGLTSYGGTSTEGVKTVYAQFRDPSGNPSTSYTDTIIYDRTAPTGTISINSGAATAYNISVILNMTANDAGSGISQMRFSNDNSTWSGWENYASLKSSWNLSLYGGNSTQGNKYVYAQLKDVAGNISTSFNDTINYTAYEVTVTKSASTTTAVPGDTITYTIIIRNNSTSPVTALVLTEPIPSGTTYVAGSATANSVALTDTADSDAFRFATNGIWQFPSLAGSATTTVTFKVRIN